MNFLMTIFFSLLISMVNCQELTKCYQCVNCEEPFKKDSFRNTIQTCKDEFAKVFLCKKVTVRYPLWPSQVQKACVPAAECIGRSNWMWSYGTSVDCCSTDLCNGAKKLSLVTLSLLANVILSICLVS